MQDNTLQTLTKVLREAYHQAKRNEFDWLYNDTEAIEQAANDLNIEL